MEVTNNNVRNIRTVQGDGYMTVFSLFILQRTLRSYGSCFNYGSNLIWKFKICTANKFCRIF